MGRGDPAHHPIRDAQETDRRQRPRDDQSAVESVHDLATGARIDEERADDGGQNRESSQRERIGDRGKGVVPEQQGAEQHGRDNRHRVGFEKVRRHSGAVSDIIANVVGDDCGVPRIVFGYSGLDFADEVGSHVRPLGEDAAAQTREDRDQRAAECQTDERLD